MPSVARRLFRGFISNSVVDDGTPDYRRCRGMPVGRRWRRLSDKAGTTRCKCVGVVRQGDAPAADRVPRAPRLLSSPATVQPEGSPMPADLKPADHRLRLDDKAIEAAKRNSEEGVVTPAYGPWRDEIVRLLNDALA